MTYSEITLDFVIFTLQEIPIARMAIQDIETTAKSRRTTGLVPVALPRVEYSLMKGGADLGTSLLPLLHW